MQNPQPVTLVYTTTTACNVRPGFARQTAKALGITQIIFGVLLIVLQVLSMNFYAGLMIVGHGIWCGIIVSFSVLYQVFYRDVLFRKFHTASGKVVITMHALTTELKEFYVNFKIDYRYLLCQGVNRVVP